MLWLTAIFMALAKMVSINEISYFYFEEYLTSKCSRFNLGDQKALPPFSFSFDIKSKDIASFYS